MFHDPSTGQGDAALLSAFGPPSRHGCFLRRRVMVLPVFEVGWLDRQFLLVMALTVHSRGHTSVHTEVEQWGRVPRLGARDAVGEQRGKGAAGAIKFVSSSSREVGIK